MLEAEDIGSQEEKNEYFELNMWSVFCSVSRALDLLGFRHGYRCALERKSGPTAASHAEHATTPHKALSNRNECECIVF